MIDRPLFRDEFFPSSSVVSLDAFVSFLATEQGAGDVDREEAARAMVAYLQDPSRHVQEPYFTRQEFVDWLFSRDNQVGFERENKSSFSLSLLLSPMSLRV